MLSQFKPDILGLNDILIIKSELSETV